MLVGPPHGLTPVPGIVITGREALACAPGICRIRGRTRHASCGKVGQRTDRQCLRIDDGYLKARLSRSSLERNDAVSFWKFDRLANRSDER
jgi:hypothetical protein